MKTLITEAIRGRQLLRLIYDNKRRLTAAPVLLGQTLGRKDAVLCWQVVPPVADGAPWRLLYLDRISALQRLEQRFDLSDLERHPLMDEFAVIYVAIGG